MEQLSGVAPVLLVADVVRAAGYLIDKCGFEVDRFYEEPPTFCIPQRDGIRIMLSQVEAGDRVNSNNSYDGRWDVYFWVEDGSIVRGI